jgi:hypothetical protein
MSDDAHPCFAVRSDTAMVFALPKPLRNLTVATGQGNLSLSFDTGTVTIPEGLSLDDASRKFYEALVACGYIQDSRAIIADLEDKLKHAREAAFTEMAAIAQALSPEKGTTSALSAALLEASAQGAKP